MALFEKTGRGIRLTKAGKIFYDHAVKISTDYDQAIDQMAEVAGGQGKIDIGYVFFAGRPLYSEQSAPVP